MNINKKAPVVIRHHIQIHQEPELVFRILADIPNWPSWQTDITQARLDGPVATGSVFRWKTGGLKIVSTIHQLTPPKFLGWSGRAFGTFAIHNWYLQEYHGETIVHMEESMEGWLVGLFRSMIHTKSSKAALHWLELLKQKAESAQPGT